MAVPEEDNIHYYRRYHVHILSSLYSHLLDGTKIELAEEYDIPEEKGFIGLYSKAPLDEIIQVGDRLTGFSFIPKEILCMYPRLVL